MNQSFQSVCLLWDPIKKHNHTGILENEIVLLLLQGTNITPLHLIIRNMSCQITYDLLLFQRFH